MERMKVPLGRLVWGWLTLVASLSVHGFLLSLPMSLDLEAPEVEPEPLAAVPLTTLPVTSPPSSEPENIAAHEETYEPEPENVAVDEETYEPEPEVITQPLATTVSQTRRAEESIESRQPEITSSNTQTSSLRPKKRILNNRAPKDNLNNPQETSSNSTEKVERNLETALENINSSISARLSLPERDKQGRLEKDPLTISNLLLTQPDISSPFFDDETPKKGVFQVTFIVNPEEREDEIDIQKLYDDFVEPSLIEEGFQISTIADNADKKLYQANKESLVRYVLLVSLPQRLTDNPNASQSFGTFIVVYDPEILDIDTEL